MWTHVHVVHNSACLSGNTTAGYVDKCFATPCTAGRGMIPSFMQVRSEYLNVRLCDPCMEKCTETNKSEPLVRVMALLPVSMSTL